MKSLIILAGCFASVVASGCTYSINPVLTDADLTTDVDLSGTWESVHKDPKHKPSTFSIVKDYDESLYKTTYVGTEFMIEVGKIGDSRFLQFRRADTPPEAPPLLTSLPVYGFAKFTIEGDTLTVYRINDNAAVQLFKEKTIPFIEHEPSNMVRFYVLTLDTPALQSMLKEHEEILLEKYAIFRRTEVERDGSDDVGGDTRKREHKSTPIPQ